LTNLDDPQVIARRPRQFSRRPRSGTAVPLRGTTHRLSVVKGTVPGNAGLTAIQLTTIHRARDRRERWPGAARGSARDFAYVTIFAIGCGALGAIGAALIELGVSRLFA
jgi:hypothetical protein